MNSEPRIYNGKFDAQTKRAILNFYEFIKKEAEKKMGENIDDSYLEKVENEVVKVTGVNKNALKCLLAEVSKENHKNVSYFNKCIILELLRRIYFIIFRKSQRVINFVTIID